MGRWCTGSSRRPPARRPLPARGKPSPQRTPQPTCAAFPPCSSGDVSGPSALYASPHVSNGIDQPHPPNGLSFPQSPRWYLGTVQTLIPEHQQDPEGGFGLQQAVLEEVASSERGPTALIWTSSRYVGVTRPEMRLAGFDKAVEAAMASGFPVLVRNSGGGAVAANEGSISFSLTFPVEDLRHGLYERYVEGVDLVAAAIRRTGVAAEGGEVEGEFCPGAHSVRSGGPRGIKRAGLAQRVTRRAARVEALILVSNTAELVGVLDRFYAALSLPFRPDSIGDLPATVPQAIEALSAETSERYGGEEVPVRDDLLAKARSERGKWRIASTPSRLRGRG